MTEVATTTTASEGVAVATPATVATPAEGASAGTQAVADTFAAEREQLESRARGFQGTADREKARADALEAELAALKTVGAGTEAGTSAAAPLDANALVASALEQFEIRSALKDAASTLKGEFDLADPSLFERATDFASVDALRAAVESSHNRLAAVVDARYAAREAALLADLSAKHGITLSPPSTEGTTPPAGDPTIATIAAMSFSDQVAFEAANPGVIARVLRSAN